MSHKPHMMVLVALGSALAGLITARCTSAPMLSLIPPVDLCCWCLSTHNTPRGARCSRGSISECIQDFESLDISETNPRCIRDMCGTECGLFAALLPTRSSLEQCCQCLVDNQTDGADCFTGSVEECADELDEGEPSRILQGAGLCIESVCAEACAPVFGSTIPDGGSATAGDASLFRLDSGPNASDAARPHRDGGGTPTLPWDGGCPLPWGCY